MTITALIEPSGLITSLSNNRRAPRYGMLGNSTPHSECDRVDTESPLTGEASLLQGSESSLVHIH
jgi:hypothetical protein